MNVSIINIGDELLIGQVVKSGPVFDVLGNLKGESMPSGSLITVSGSSIGHTINNYAFDTRNSNRKRYS